MWFSPEFDYDKLIFFTNLQCFGGSKLRGAACLSLSASRYPPVIYHCLTWVSALFNPSFHVWGNGISLFVTIQLLEILEISKMDMNFGLSSCWKHWKLLNLRWYSMCFVYDDWVSCHCGLWVLISVWSNSSKVLRLIVCFGLLCLAWDLCKELE